VGINSQRRGSIEARLRAGTIGETSFGDGVTGQPTGLASR